VPAAPPSWGRHPKTFTTAVVGRDHFDRRSIDWQKKRLIKRLTDLGYAVTIKPLAA
jgi:hypothetical protein